MPTPLTSFSDTPDFTELMSIILSAVSNKAEIPAITLSELIRNMFESGMTKEAIRERLLKDLREGGVIFGDFRKAFVSTFQQSLERSSQLVTNSIYKSNLPPDLLYSWVMTKTNNCEDCIERSSRNPQTLEEWELEGLPQSGVTICGLNCGCKLVPDKIRESVQERDPISLSE